MRTAERYRVDWKEAKLYVRVPAKLPRVGLWESGALEFLRRLPQREMFDLIVTSPPYNLGKEYEQRRSLREYVLWQEEIICELSCRLRSHGSICWQVGNFVDNGRIEPLDFAVHPVFKRLGLGLRNRIVWHFGHGLHCQRRFSGRYEVVLWYTKSDDYVFDLDAVRIPSKYPGKRSYKGPNLGELSGNPLGKNPEDLWATDGDAWNIPNVKGNHCEKTTHPCQFPVGLAERLVLALSQERSLVFDPFCGVGSSGVAAALHGRDYWGCDIIPEYLETAKTRIDEALHGQATYRPHSQPLFDHRESSLSRLPRKASGS